jgi:hypothetical protein
VDVREGGAAPDHVRDADESEVILVSNVELAIQTNGLLTGQALRRDTACGGMVMFRIISLSFAGFALLIGVSISAGPANAVVYCKTVGVPKGCVVRPAVVAPVVVAPVAGPVVYCKTRGVPKGCVMR